MSPTDGSPATSIVVDRRQQQQRLDLRLRQRDVVGDHLPRGGRRDGRSRGVVRGDVHQAWIDDSGAGARPGRPARPIWRSTWRRMSFIGSTERTRGMTSKLLTGGGDVVNHSSVLAFHGSGPGDRAVLRAAHDVDDRHQDARGEDERADRRDQVVELEVPDVRVLVDAPRHAVEARSSAGSGT